MEETKHESKVLPNSKSVLEENLTINQKCSGPKDNQQMKLYKILSGITITHTSGEQNSCENRG